MCKSFENKIKVRNHASDWLIPDESTNQRPGFQLQLQSITYYLVLVGHRKYIFSDQTLHARASIMILERHQLSVSGFFKEFQNDILCNNKLCVIIPF